MYKLLLPALCALLLAACAPIVRVNENAAQTPAPADVSPRAGYPVTIENIDAKGNPATDTYDAPPRRIVAVWQNSIETPLALGAGDRLIAGMGVPDRKYLSPAYQEAYDRIPYTSLENLDVETVLMMEPDLIIGWASTFSPKVLRGTDFWHARGIHTYIAPSSSAARARKTIDDECRDILSLGKILGHPARAEELVRAMRSEIAFVAEQTRDAARRPRALVIEPMDRDIRAYGDNSLAGDILRALHAENLGADGLNLSLEQIIEMDPDAIFLVVVESDYDRAAEIKARFCDTPALRGLSCIRAGRVDTLPLYTVYSAGTRTYDGIRIIAAGLYPSLYKE